MHEGPCRKRGPFLFSVFDANPSNSLKILLVAARRMLHQMRHSDGGARPARLEPPHRAPPRHALQTFPFLCECQCAGARRSPAVQAATREEEILPGKKDEPARTGPRQ